MRYCVQQATAKDVALLALAMGDEDAGDTKCDGEQKPLDHLLNAFLSSTEVWAAHDAQGQPCALWGVSPTSQDFDIGRTDADPILSRKAFVSLASNYGTLSVGRLQTLLFDTTTRFNAMGNSVAFSPAVRHIFASGNIEGVQEDFYWSRGAGYVSPNWGGVTGSVMYAKGRSDEHSDLFGANIVLSRGLFAAALSMQKVHFNDGINDPTDERTWQLGATYNFGWARLFGLYTHTDDNGLDVRSNIYSGGAEVPMGPGFLQLQAGFTKATGPAVDRKHTSLSAAYLYTFNSVTDFYIVGMNDRIRGQTDGISVAIGARYRF